MCKIIAISNPKGGVGKTTTVINLASSLAIAQKRVLVVDLDPQGATSSGLGFGNGKVTQSLPEVFLNEHTIFKAIYPAIFDNMYLLPCKITNMEQEKQLLENAKNIFRLKTALFNLVLHHESFYDYILIDTPPNTNSLTLGALVAANSVLIPLQCGRYALDATRKLIQTIAMVKKTTNPNLEVEGILLTFFEKNTRLTRQVLEEIPQEYRKYLFKTIVNKNSAIGYAVFKQRPVALVDFNSSGAQAYFSLASEILRKNNGVNGDSSRYFYI